MSAKKVGDINSAASGGPWNFDLDSLNPVRNLGETTCFGISIYFWSIIIRNLIARTINLFSDFGDKSCLNLFKLRNEDLRVLYRRLRLPFRARFDVDNISVMFGEEIVLAGLWRLCSIETDVKLFSSLFYFILFYYSHSRKMELLF